MYLTGVACVNVTVCSMTDITVVSVRLYTIVMMPVNGVYFLSILFTGISMVLFFGMICQLKASR